VANLATGPTYRRRHRADLSPHQITISPDEGQVLVHWSDGLGDGVVEAVDLRTGKDRWRFDPTRDHRKPGK
jgi:PQQ enzyme repeat.